MRKTRSNKNENLRLFVPSGKFCFLREVGQGDESTATEEGCAVCLFACLCY